MAKFWFEQGESIHPYERDALRWVQSWFPTHEPWRAFSRFSFPGSDGRDHEVDLLVAGPTGCFLIEFKGYEGRIIGGARDLVSHSAKRRVAFDHPKPLLKFKIDKLVDALKHTGSYKSRTSRPPFIEPLVFMHHADALEIASPGNIGVLLRDREAADGKLIDGLKAAILERRAPWMQPIAAGERRIDKPAAKLLTRAIEEIAFFGPRPPVVAGSWQLEAAPIEEATAWSDYQAVHKVTGERRTVRVYIAPRGREIERNRLENAARLEFEALRTFDHPGVLRAHELDECDLGFAIAFENTKDFVRLDHFVLTRGASLDFGARLGLVRQLCEAVSATHDRGLAHRGLSPSSVLVANPDSDRPVIKLRNWHRRMRTDAAERAGLRTFGGETISDVAAASADLAEVERTYLAPELRAVGELGGIASDIYSLGALAYLIFTGQPPAQSLDELDGILTRQQHLAVSQHLNGASAGIERFVARSAHASPTQRASTARELIECLDKAQDELARPEFAEVHGPDDLLKDTLLDGGADGVLQVVRRLGSGGTAVGFEVTRDGTSFALKVARSADLNPRIEAEAKALANLKHDHIVSLVGTLDVGPCRALLLWPFGGETLHDYLKRDGALQLDFLERWGEQLLRAVEHLENEGRSHRDIKPGNIAITDRGQKKAQQIVLFDFSLAALPADNLQAGTAGYIDPFLGVGSRRAWDLAAERYAAAVTLYEMATGVRPVWGDGQTLTHLLRDVDLPKLDPDLLPEVVRASLLTFFQRALQRDATKRFDSATAMREAWKKALEGGAVTIIGTDTAGGDAPSLSSALDAAVAGAGIDTIIPTLPLSARAQNALFRLGVDSLGDLLRRSPHSLRWLPGVGSTTQKELVELYQEARKRFPAIEVTIRSIEDSTAEAAGRRSGAGTRKRGASTRPARANAPLAADATLEALAKSLLERNREGGSRSNEALADYLGIGSSMGTEPPEPRSMQAAADAYGLTRAAVHIAIDSAVKRWRRNPAFSHAATVVHELLEARGGIATLHEIGVAIGTRLPVDGSSTPEQRARAGFAVALSVAEAEKRSEDHPRYELRRVGRRAFVVAHGLDAAAPYAAELGKAADELVDPNQPVLPGPAACLTMLRAIARPAELAELANERLLALAAASSTRARLNGRGELYPVGLDARRALKLSQGAIAGLGSTDRATRRRAFTVAELRERMAQRYPEAAPLPDAPECIAIVREVLGAETDFDAGRGLFLVRAAEAMTVQTGSGSRPTMYVTQVGAQPFDSHQQAVNRANEFNREVQSALVDRRVLVVRVQPASFARAVPRLAQAFGVRAVSLDGLIVDGLHEVAARKGIDLARVHTADAAWPTGPDTARLRAVLEIVRKEHLAPALLYPDGPILVTDWGLAFRYGMQGLYTELRDACGRGAHPGALCALPADDAEQAVVLDGHNFPEFDPARMLRVPGAWLRIEAA
jgi:serine/threonine protein kinase